MEDPPIFPIIIGVTGHRDIAPEASADVLKSVRIVLKDWKVRFGSALHVMTALAEGADQLVADAARSLDIPIIAVLPMPRALYLPTLRTRAGRDNMDRHWERAALQLELPEIGNQDDPDYHERQFEQLGVLLIRRSHLLLALWDGTRDTTNRSGAAAVVRMRLEGDHAAEAFKSSAMFLEASSYLDVTNRGPLLQVVTPSGQIANNQAGTCLLFGIPRPASKDRDNGGSVADAVWEATAVEPDDVPRTIRSRGVTDFDRIDELNRGMADFRGSDALIFEQQLGYLDVTGIPEEAYQSARVLLRQQAGADTAAQAHQVRLLGHFVPASSPWHMLMNGYKAWRRTGGFPKFGAVFVFAAIGPLAVCLFETHVANHETMKGPVALFFYFVFLVGTACYYFLYVARQDWQGHFQDYRALAEGMRVQLYWAVAGVPAAVSDHYLRKQSDELGWIQFALRGPSLWAAALATMLNVPNRTVVMRGWVENQAHYFGDKAQLHHGAFRHGFNTTLHLAICGLGVTFLLLALEVCDQFSSWLGEGMAGSLALMKKFHEYLIVVAATLPALAASFLLSRELRAYEPAANSYALMYRMFSHAAEEARKPDQSDQDFKQLIRELGREALSENAEWLSEHRHRRIELHF